MRCFTKECRKNNHILIFLLILVLLINFNFILNIKKNFSTLNLTNQTTEKLTNNILHIFFSTPIYYLLCTHTGLSFLKA